MSRTYHYKDKEYKTFSELWCEIKDLCEVSSPSFKKRLEGGWSIHRAIIEPRGFMPNKEVFWFQGNKYPTMESMFKANKHLTSCSFPTFKLRVAEGLTYKEAFEAEKKKTGANKIEPQVIEGKIFYNIKEIAEAYNVNFNTMFKRWSRGGRNENLIKGSERKVKVVTPEVIKAKKEKVFITFRGVEYRSRAKFLKAFECNVSTFKTRVARGATIEQALGLEPMRDGRSHAAGVQRFDWKGENLSVEQISAQTGVASATIRDRFTAWC